MEAASLPSPPPSPNRRRHPATDWRPPRLPERPARAVRVSVEAAETAPIEAPLTEEEIVAAETRAAEIAASAARWAEARQEHAALPGERPGASYTSTQAAIVLSLLAHEKWSNCYSQDEDGKLVGDSECRVCLVDYEEDDSIVRLPCMHYAHSQCMENWLLRHPRCPVCQTNLQEVLTPDT